MHFFSLVDLSTIPIIILSIIGLSFLIGFHEAGHFLFCKLFGVKTPSFSIGFGPKIYSKKIGDTEFILSAIPLGGFVEIAGAQEVGQGDQKEAFSTAHDSFAAKPYYQKMLIIAGGIIFNLIYAQIVLTLLFMMGTPKTSLLHPRSTSNVAEQIIPGSPAEHAGITHGDVIKQIDDLSVTDDSMHLFFDVLSKKSGLPVVVSIDKNGTEVQKNIILGNGIQEPLLGIKFFSKAIEPHDFFHAFSASISTIFYWLKATFSSFKMMIQKKTTQGLGGPVAILSEAMKSARHGFASFFILLCFISVNLAAINIIPLPIFDGGQALFYTLEGIFGISFNKLKIYIHYITWIFLMALMLYLTCKDIMKICL